MKPSARDGSIAPLSETSADMEGGIINPTWEQLYKLQQQFSDSFYLFSESKFVENYNHFLSAFSGIYPNSRIAYSYKTNYLPRICQLVNDRDGYAEVVSSMELELARSVGVASDRIVFNGPYKTKADIQDALRTGVILNLDSPYEISYLSRVAEKYPGNHFSVGIRCNLAVGGLERSRFGFDASGDELEAVVSRVQALGSVSVVGLHCHYCPEGRLPRTYADIMEAMIDLAKRVIPSTNLRYIDIGGGFFSHMPPELRSQFPGHVADVKEYADTIAPLMAIAFNGSHQPELILEPGLALTADTMVFCAKVIDVKVVDDRRVVLVSGSKYDVKPTLTGKNLPTRVISRHDGNSGSDRSRKTIIVGYSCMEDDVLHHGFEGNIEPEDYVLFENTGAYTLVLRPPFIRPGSPVLSWRGDVNSVEVLRRREKNSDIFATYLNT